jgi:hypothetical protein
MPLLSLILLGSGCRGADSAVGPSFDRRLSLSGCEETRPNGDSPDATMSDPLPTDCPIETQDHQIEHTYVRDPSSPVPPGGAPNWEGQNFSFSDVQNSPNSSSICYDVIDNFPFSRITPEGTIETFFVVGASYKIADLPPLGGVARARYQLPFDYIYSRSRRLPFARRDSRRSMYSSRI